MAKRVNKSKVGDSAKKTEEKPTKGGKGKIQEHPKANTNGFDKRPDEAGRPKKTFSLLNEQLKDEGYEKLTKTNYLETLSLLMSIDEGKMLEIASDKSQPYYLRLMAKNLNDKHIRFKAMNDYRDFLMGKAEQKTDITSGGERITSIIIEGLNDKSEGI